MLLSTIRLQTLVQTLWHPLHPYARTGPSPSWNLGEAAIESLAGNFAIQLSVSLFPNGFSHH